MLNKVCTSLTPAFLLLLCLSGCGQLLTEAKPRFFWPPPPGEPKIEYLNFYFSDEDLQRGVDRRLEHAILGQRNPVRLLNLPFSVASDGKGRIFVADLSGNQVVVLDRSAHTSRNLIGTVETPQKVVVDERGEIWLLVASARKVFRYAADETKLEEIELPELGRATSLAVDAQRQRLYLSDTPNHLIRVYDFSGAPVATFGKRGNGLGEFNFPGDLDLDREGNLYIVDAMNARIEVFSPDGTFLRAFGERGTESGSFSIPKGIAVSPSDIVFVTDAGQHKVVVFSTSGEHLITLGGRYVYDGTSISPGGLYFPAGIDVDRQESIVVADLFNGMVHEFQFLTPEYLATHPIAKGQAYTVKPQDLAPKTNAPGTDPAPAESAR